MTTKQSSKVRFSPGEWIQAVIDAKPEWLPWPVAILLVAVILFAVVFPLAFQVFDIVVLRARGG